MSDFLALVDALRSTLAKMEQVLGTVNEAIVWTDVTGRILWCNATFDQLVEQRHIVNLGSSLQDRLPLLEHDLGVPCSTHPVTLALQPNNKGLGLYGLQKGDQQRVLEVAWSSFHEKDTGQDGGWSAVLVIRDVTERHQSEVALRESKVLLEQQIKALKQADAQIRQQNEELNRINLDLMRANRLKDEFLATMSHELRTPLNAILGMTEGLRSEGFGGLNERQQRSLSTVERNGKQLLALITDILDVAKVGAGQLDLAIEPVIVDHLCNVSVAAAQSKATRKRIQLAMTLQDGLVEVAVDHLQMRLVLNHLLDNAIKFTPEGGQVTLHVYLDDFEQIGNAVGNRMGAEPLISEHHQLLCFAVTDTGIGIADADLERLFQPFIQLDGNLNRSYEGTGLGLFLVKQIVDLHRGHITIQSTPGQGSCFTVRLPQSCDLIKLRGALPLHSSSLAISTEMMHSTTSVAIAPPPIAPSLDSQALILLVDANVAQSRSITSYFKAKGYRLRVATTAQEAIALAQPHLPDAVLIDSALLAEQPQTMLQLLQLLRPVSPELPQPDPGIILLVDANPVVGDRGVGFTHDCEMIKPVNLKQLFTMVQELLTSRQSNR